MSQKVKPEDEPNATFQGVVATPQTDGDPLLVFQKEGDPVGVRLTDDEFESMFDDLRTFKELG